MDRKYAIAKSIRKQASQNHRGNPKGEKPPLFIRSIYPTLHLLQGLTMPKFSQLGEVEKLEV
jgi:hypothetical protein